jgi:uncharacterized ion transporter superfamily protein YfcC
MDERNDDSRRKIRRIVFLALKATIKATIFYAIYFIVSGFLAPVSELIPGFQQMVETFVMVYIVLMIIGDLTSGTIYQHFFNAAKALFVMAYLILSLNGGLFGVTFENVNLVVDLRLFLVVAMLLSLLGLAKSVLQAINYMNEKAEPKLL